MFNLPSDDDSMAADTQGMAAKSLKCLGESVQSILGCKTGLAFTWADAVRLMIEDLSASSDSSGCIPGVEVSEDEKLRLGETIAILEGELNALRTYLAQYDTKRRDALNKLLDLKGSIRVFCRLRPFLENEKTRARRGSIVAPRSDTVVVNIGRGKTREYRFDKVFLPEASQDDVFAEVEPILRSALDGNNACIFAYGQTGSGKTFTMEGTADLPGVVPHTLKEIFRWAAALNPTVAFTFTFSMLEVYMGQLRDLLGHGPAVRLTDPNSHKCLSIHMDAHGCVEVENLREVSVTDFSQANRWYRIGSRARSTAWTSSNETSSRSHCLIRISIRSSGGEERKTSTSKLWMVDLGGSERLLKTNASGQTMEEGKAINLSLSALGDVISALQRKQHHVPYRNSKLTQILRDSLGIPGNNTKTLMLVHISPKEEDLGETVCSLNFATRARGTHIGKELSAEVKEHREAIMDELVQYLRHVEDECQSARNSVRSVEFLLREKKKSLAMNDPSPETVQKDSVMEAAIIVHELGRGVGERSAGLPRFMNPTACSRLRGSSDSNSTSPGTERKRSEARDHNNVRRKPLAICARKLSSSKQGVIEMEWNASKKRSSMHNNGEFRGAGLVSRQSVINESRRLSECNTPRDSHGMSHFSVPNRSRVAGSSYSKKSRLSDELKRIPESKNGGMRPPSLPNNKRVSGSHNSKLFATSPESQSTVSDSNYQRDLQMDTGNADHNSTQIVAIKHSGDGRKPREAMATQDTPEETPSPGDFQARATSSAPTHESRIPLDRQLSTRSP